MAFSRRVLLAEDSPINQEVGRAMLETLGCTVEVASNGLEALRLVESNRYDLVFMDCQMPVMDGWEATEKIRQAENARAYRTPIIAMTAYMLDEERERCRTSGMDDYLGKPFSLRELSETLNRWITPGTEERMPEIGPAEPPAAADAGVPCLDPEALNNLRLVFGPSAADMIPMVIKIYLDDSVNILDELRKSLDAGDLDSMGRAAHTLKSSSANLGANALSEMCREVEQLARSKSAGSAESLIGRIEAEYRRVERALREVLNKGE